MLQLIFSDYRYKFEAIVCFEVNTEARPSECSSIRLFRLLVHKLDSEEEVAGKSRPVNVARVTVRSRVEIVLEGIEHVLHSGIQLQREAPVHLEVISSLDSHVPEVPGLSLLQ